MTTALISLMVLTYAPHRLAQCRSVRLCKYGGDCTWMADLGATVSVLRLLSMLVRIAPADAAIV